MSSSKFLKDEIVRARRASAIYSLWKIYKCLLHQITREIILLLVDNVHEKTSQKVKTDEILKAVRFDLHYFALVLHENALVLHENALVFSQSEARDFFMYIITTKI